jgi:GNAT superfamily N-acetyltransferase
MTDTPHDLPAMLRLAVAAWPALETAGIDGWLWRASGGGSKRANSVSALSFTGADPETAIDAIEARYSARGQVPRFQIDDISAPADLARRLLARGYREEEVTLTMTKSIGAADPPSSCEIAAEPTAAWLAVYLSAITPDRRAVNQLILDRVPAPRAFILCRDAGIARSTGLCVVSGDDAIVECMATSAAGRRTGGASAVLASIESWAAQRGARATCLQVVDGNAPAISLYHNAGYATAATTRYFVRPA